MTVSESNSTIAHHLPPDHHGASLRADVLAGLTGSAKTLPPKWLYDAAGSALFEQITELPEYYPTRTERAVLESHAGEIAAACPAETLIELGSGSSRKTPVLLNALRGNGAALAGSGAALAGPGALRRYIAVDVSDTALLEARSELVRAFDDIELLAVAADFETQLHVLPQQGRTMVAFLGGTIGNLEPHARERFLRQIRDQLAPTGGSLLVGTGLVAPLDVLIPAYDDAAGVTAAFNRNVLRVLNTELGADFDIAAFEHVAIWDPDQEWIEMRLRATRPMQVRLPGVDLCIRFDEGEEIRTEISAKFRPSGITAELEAAGLSAAGQWTDEHSRYALTLAEVR